MLSSGFRLCRARRLLRRNELGCIVRDVVQIIVALVAIVWSAVITGIIAFALEKTIGWRVTEAQEVGGIDLADQGERAYDFAGTASSVLKEVK